MTSQAPKNIKNSKTKNSKTKNRKTLWIALIIVVGLVVTGAVYFMTRDNTDPEAPTVATSIPIAITGLKVPAQTKVGVIVTFGSGALEGTQWNQGAQGARVAQQRLALGGTDVELVTLNDQGSPEGAKKAIAALADEGVSGIIVATSGPQVQDALEAVKESGIPTILAYTEIPTKVDHARSLYPMGSEFDDVLEEAIGSYDNALLIDAGEQISEKIDVGDVLSFTAGEDLLSLADQVAQVTGSDVSTNGAYFGGDKETGDKETTDTEEPANTEAAPANASHDAVLISGPPALQAKIVHALQTKNVGVPIVLTPSATSAGFATALFEAGGTVAPNLITVGTADGESIALQKNEHGQSMSAFFAALRAFSADQEVLNLTEDDSFGNAAPYADPVSHDAVLAMVKAVSEAKNTDPAQVATAFTLLDLKPRDGIAGRALDFSAGPYPSTNEFQVLHATSQNLGLRGQVEDGSQSLVWFPQP